MVQNFVKVINFENRLIRNFLILKTTVVFKMGKNNNLKNRGSF
jgi:hypothetical protein